MPRRSTAGTLAAGHASADINTTCTNTLVASPTVFDTGQHCFVIPANVTSIHAVLIGGSGGAGLTGSGGGGPSESVAELGGTGGLGGHGMQVSGDIPVTAGEVLWVYVGGNGQAGSTDGGGGAGGFNGGAQGGGISDDEQSLAGGGGGGGATDLRTAQATTPFTDCSGGDSAQNKAAGAAGTFVLVAGGGGGGGNGSDGLPNDYAKTATITPDGGNGGSQPGDLKPAECRHRRHARGWRRRRSGYDFGGW